MKNTTGKWAIVAAICAALVNVDTQGQMNTHRSRNNNLNPATNPNPQFQGGIALAQNDDTSGDSSDNDFPPAPEPAPSPTPIPIPVPVPPGPSPRPIPPAPLPVPIPRPRPAPAPMPIPVPIRPMPMPRPIPVPIPMPAPVFRAYLTPTIQNRSRICLRHTLACFSRLDQSELITPRIARQVAQEFGPFAVPVMGPCNPEICYDLGLTYSLGKCRIPLSVDPREVRANIFDNCAEQVSWPTPLVQFFLGL